MYYLCMNRLTSEKRTVSLTALVDGCSIRGTARTAGVTKNAVLKLLADVGLLGFPNVGKSTLISRLSAAKPKIADYPFTTLTPNLGVVELPNYAACVMADIPGLIPGARTGKGLGLDFLKHLEHTRLLVHILDLATVETGRAPWDDFMVINHELACFSPELAQRPQIVVASKMDVPEVRQRFPEVQRQFAPHGVEVLPISAVTGEGLEALIHRQAVIIGIGKRADES